jgi:uncharacterized protein
MRAQFCGKAKLTVALVGVDDLWAGKPDWHKAFSNVPEGVSIVLLSHNPDATLFWMPASEQEKFLTKHAAVSKADLQRYGKFLASPFRQTHPVRTHSRRSCLAAP